MTDHISDFIDHMRASGIGPADPAEIIDDDKPHRYRLEGDKTKQRNGSYQLGAQADGFAFGWCRSFKEGVTYNWHTKATRKASEQERAEWKRKAAEAKAVRKAEIDDQARKASEKAARIWDAAGQGVTAYHARKQIEAHGAKVWRDMAVVPMRKDGALVGLQFIQSDGAKRFLTGCAKEGSYFSIAKKADDLSLIVICEGYATGASIRQAIGCPVIVAFDAGNLKPVAQAIRKKYPDAAIVIAADNDQWTRKPDGADWNPGVEKAQQAAVAIGGARVIAPLVPPDDADRRTDWNDIAVTDGLDAVRLALTSAPEPIPEYDHYEPEQDHHQPAIEDPLDAIRPLGHNRGTYYFFPRAAGQIVDLSSTGMGKMQNLYMLAPRAFWEGHYGGDKISDSQICAYASAHLIEACHRKGIFEPESTRGVGAWLDRGRVVINTGDTVICDGARWHPAEFRGEAVYESGPRVIDLDCEPLRNKEAVRLRDVCRSLNWKRGMYADLLAGWLVIAPVGSALSWRPHVWITGRSGAGKSTVLDKIVKEVLGNVAIRRDGGTTEAGVRKALGCSGRPYVLDEAESETAQDRQQMERIIFLARRSSSGGVVENFNASFQARSCFCFSAINPRVEQTADKGRITQLELMADVSPDRDARYDRLLRLIHEVITPDFAARLLARTVALMPALLENCRTFSLAASAVLGNKRAGDQIGPMIAGAFSLTSNKTISYGEAKAWIEAQDWDWNTGSDDDTDAHKLVTYIMTSRVGYDVQGARRESSIGEMIGAASSPSAMGHDAAVQGLKGYGVAVDGNRIMIANNSPQMRKLLSDTPWIPWNRTLSDYPGSDNNKNKPRYFAPGLVSKCIAIPITAVLPDALPTESEIPFDEEPF
jgi:putative DNA primase/helicase